MAILTNPRWATDPTADVVEPTEAKKDLGWANADKPPAGYFNWWMREVHRTLDRLDALRFAQTAKIGTSQRILDMHLGAPGGDIAVGESGLVVGFTLGGPPDAVTEYPTDGSTDRRGVTYSPDSAKWIATTATGLQTADGGLIPAADPSTWTSVATQPTGSYHHVLAGTRTNSAVVIALATTVGGDLIIARSTDGGLSFTQAHSVAGGAGGVVEDGGTKWLVAAEGGGLLYSDDDGATWSQMAGGYLHVAYDPDRGLWLAMGGSGALYAAADPTGAWAQIPQAPTGYAGSVYHDRCAVGPGGEWVVYGGELGPARSVDGGTTWLSGIDGAGGMLHHAGRWCGFGGSYISWGPMVPSPT